MIRYRLYELASTMRVLEAVQEKQRFFRATPDHVLVYTRGRKPEGGTLVKNVAALCATDKAWLEGCNIIIAEELLQKSQEAQGKMTAFLSSLEKELEKERDLLRGSAGNG